MSTATPDCSHPFEGLRVPDTTDSNYNHHVGMHVCLACGQAVAPQAVLDSAAECMRTRYVRVAYLPYATKPDGKRAWPT